MSLLLASYLAGLTGSNLGALALVYTPKTDLEMSKLNAFILATLFGLFLSTVFYVAVSGFEVSYSVILGFCAFCFAAIYRYLKNPEKLLKLAKRIE